jgi:hypothetical protein
MAVGGLITNKGKITMMNRMYKNTPDYTEPVQFSVGIGTTTPNVADTDLETVIPIDGTEEIDNFDTADWADGTDTVSGTNIVRYKKGNTSLYVSKTGTAGTTATISKTTTSLDFTSKDLWGWVYITDVTDLVASGTALTVRFGSAVGDYYYYDIDITDLSNGWNYIKFSSATATGTTGAPTIGACDYTAIILNVDLAADLIASDRIMFDDFRLAQTVDYFNTFVSGYPTLDETEKTATIRCSLSSIQANGWDLSEVGIFNNDGTKLMNSRDVFTPESKADTDEFVFVIIDELV